MAGSNPQNPMGELIVWIVSGGIVAAVMAAIIYAMIPLIPGL